MASQDLITAIDNLTLAINSVDSKLSSVVSNVSVGTSLELIKLAILNISSQTDNTALKALSESIQNVGINAEFTPLTEINIDVPYEVKQIKPKKEEFE